MSAAKSWHLCGKEELTMSRIGRKPIQVPSGVDVKIDGHHITVKGPKGTLEREIHKDMTARSTA